MTTNTNANAAMNSTAEDRAFEDWYKKYCVPVDASVKLSMRYAWCAAIASAAQQPADDSRTRLLSALERAAIAETALRALTDECDNDSAPGWEERMSACIAEANRVLAAAPKEAKVQPAPREPLSHEQALRVAKACGMNFHPAQFSSVLETETDEHTLYEFAKALMAAYGIAERKEQSND